ncbi:ABC transporter substrate-binding protein [Jatrophihabitans sp.]|uniref:ABC transporter substrate-binding protein n=1 Tax=Jatrophihabitans sp. TaxID=1932789 RepID=UPI0030C70521|nr:hypothetical protein [Jatrophihabitans sp.]
MHRKLNLAIASVAIAVLATACSSSGGKSGGDSSGASTPASTGSSSTSAATTGADIVIGNVSPLSGAQADSNGPFLDGVKAWVGYVNDNGGISGHKIKLVTGDSKSDSTTEASQIQQIVGNDHVVAFVGNGNINPPAWINFLEGKGVPVIGGNNASISYNDSPMLFPEGSSVIGNALGLAAHNPGETKFGYLYCKEAPGCAETNASLFKGGVAKLAGTDPVFSRAVSLSQPSYTAECLAAKQAGVQTLGLGADPNTVIRIANDCAKQGFKPTYVIPGVVANDSLPSKLGSTKLLAALPDFPWFSTDPATASFRASMAKYVSGKAITESAAEGWVSGLIFQKAATTALASGGTLTSASLITALGQIKNDTFGGLTPPLSFVAGAAQPSSYCFYPAEVVNGKWTTPGGLTVTCPSASNVSALDTITAAAVKASK